TMLDHIPVAYAVTYIFGTAGTAWILATLGPRLLGFDLAASCKEYEAKLAGGKEVSGLTGYRMFAARAYRIHDALAGKTVEQLESQFGEFRVFLERIRRDGEIIEANPATQLKAGDVVGL